MTKTKISQLEKLELRKSKLEERKYKAQIEEHRKLDNIGWGAGMRGYKCMRINFSKSGKIQEQIDEVNQKIKELQEQEKDIVDKINWDELKRRLNEPEEQAKSIERINEGLSAYGLSI